MDSSSDSENDSDKEVRTFIVKQGLLVFFEDFNFDMW